MANIRQFLKTLALTRLPRSWLGPLKTWHYARVVRDFGESDEPELAVVRRLVEPNTTVIDLGANVGVYTKWLSSLTGAGGRVIAVEPIAETFGILSRVVRRLGLTNVRLVNAAVSDGGGSVVMEVPRSDLGGDNIYRAQVVNGTAQMGDDQRRTIVPAVTLDELLSGETRVSFVKCDVEGHELNCLAGAEGVISTHRPAWLIEVWGDPDTPDSQAARVFPVLENQGYGVWLFDAGSLHRRRPGERTTNYFFLTESHVSRLRDVAPNLVV
jgi:FkbM family methyltransferase